LEETPLEQPPAEWAPISAKVRGEPPAPTPPPRRRPRSRLLYLLAPLLRAILYLIAYILVEGALAVFLRALPFLVSGPLFRPGGFGNSVEFSLLVVMISIPPQLLVIWLFARFLDHRTLASLGFRWPEGGRPAALRQLVTASLGALAVLGVWLALIVALPDTLARVRFGGLSPEFIRSPSWWPLPSVLLLGLLLLAFILQGGVEEWIMRGYIYRTLRERWPPWVSALTSSLLFSLLHAANPNVSRVALLNIVLAGMVLAALVERTGSLWSATLAHGVWNFAVACLLSVPVSGVRIFHLLNVEIGGDPTVTGGGFGPEGSSVLTGIGILLTAWLWRGMWRRAGDRPWAAVRPSARPSAPEDVPGPLSS
jgi:membrane protease YdiL (CAAX protease family)